MARKTRSKWANFCSFPTEVHIWAWSLGGWRDCEWHQSCLWELEVWSPLSLTWCVYLYTHVHFPWAMCVCVRVCVCVCGVGSVFTLHLHTANTSDNTGFAGGLFSNKTPQEKWKDNLFLFFCKLRKPISGNAFDYQDKKQNKTKQTTTTKTPQSKSILNVAWWAFHPSFHFRIWDLTSSFADILK